jgi:hypothetical protein
MDPELVSDRATVVFVLFCFFLVLTIGQSCSLSATSLICGAYALHHFNIPPKKQEKPKNSKSYEESKSG